MAKYVGRAIKSVLCQSFRNWELIVIDDGSTDGSIDVIKRAAVDDPRCHVYRTENQGVAEARNLAIGSATGEWILPLDADDWLQKNALYEFALAIDRNPNAALIVPWVHHTSKDRDWIVRRLYKGFDSLKKQNCLPNSCCFRKSRWKSIGGYRNGTMYEDWEFWLRYLSVDCKVVSLQIPVIEYTVRPGSRVKVAEQRHREEVEILRQLNPDIYGKSN